MARKTRSPNFAVYEDAGPPTPGSAYQHSVDANPASRKGALDNTSTHDDDDDVFGATEDLRTEHDRIDAGTLLDIVGDDHNDDDRRASALTSASISSFPDSTIDLHNQRLDAMHPPYTSPMIRPSFRRISSVRRLQMTSPTPYDRRRSVLHHHSRRPSSRMGRSNLRSSLRSKIFQDEGETDDERKYPLILLHVTMLPLELQWSRRVIQELLPQDIMDNLELLHSKISETIAQRGILIQHPHAEYDLLEERLLQALELKNERVTKCGHFRARDSTSSVLSSSESSDSGLGSDSETCITCHQQLKLAKSGVASSRTWSVRVFAANGLLGSSAWAAAWADMERVDVEILPWIDHDLRRTLDAKQEEEDAEQRLSQEEEEARIKQIVEQQVRIAHDEMKRLTIAEAGVLSSPTEQLQEKHSLPSGETFSTSRAQSSPSHGNRSENSDLPHVYQPKDIPLSILLQNYVFLLARDTRNVAIFILAATVLLLSLRSMVVAMPSATSIMSETHAVPQLSFVQTLPANTTSNATMDVMHNMESPSMIAASNETTDGRVEKQGTAEINEQEHHAR